MSRPCGFLLPHPSPHLTCRPSCQVSMTFPAAICMSRSTVIRVTLFHLTCCVSPKICRRQHAVHSVLLLMTPWLLSWTFASLHRQRLGFWLLPLTWQCYAQFMAHFTMCLATDRAEAGMKPWQPTTVITCSTIYMTNPVRRHSTEIRFVHDMLSSTLAPEPCRRLKDSFCTGMGSQEAALAGLHAEAVALLMRLELAAGQAGCRAAATRHQTQLAASLDKRRSQAAIWGKTTVTQQRLDQTKLQKVCCLLFLHAKPNA